MSDPAREQADIECMARLKEGDDSALNTIMERWKLPLIQFLYRHTGHQHEAVDLAQETFVRIYEQREKYQPTGKFSTWLFTIANNLARSQARWRRRHPTVSMEAPQDARAEGTDSQRDTADEKAETADKSLLKEERAQAVRAAVATLPDKLRIPILLSEYEDLSQAEIGAILGCSPKAVELRLYRARQVLREKLSRYLR